MCKHFWQLRWGIDYFTRVKHEGWKLRHQRIQPRQEQHHQPTFDTLTEEGHKVFEAYRANLEELFLPRCEVAWQGTILKDTTAFIFHKVEVIPKVRSDPSSSHNDIQYMINSALERQAKSTNELLCTNELFLSQ
jgi:hypothetical protein